MQTAETIDHTGQIDTVQSLASAVNAFNENADYVFTLKREDRDEHRVILHCKHTRDFERPPDIILKGVPVELGYNDPI